MERRTGKARLFERVRPHEHVARGTLGALVQLVGFPGCQGNLICALNILRFQARAFGDFSKHGNFA